MRFSPHLGSHVDFLLVEHINVIQPRCQFPVVPADILIESFEPVFVFYPVSARHEHDMASVPMSGHDSQTAIAVVLLDVVGHSCGDIRCLSGRQILPYKAIRLKNLFMVFRSPAFAKSLANNIVPYFCFLHRKVFCFQCFAFLSSVGLCHQKTFFWR